MMKEVLPGLWVGNIQDYDAVVQPEGADWATVHACKEPYHRAEMTKLGFPKPAAPKDHPEYLIMYRGENNSHLILNMIDPPKAEYIPKQLVDTAIEFIGGWLAKGRKVFVHCNQGNSRAPSIVLLYMARWGMVNFLNPEAAIDWFKKTHYPDYDPGKGMADFVVANLTSYQAQSPKEAPKPQAE